MILLEKKAYMVPHLLMKRKDIDIDIVEEKDSTPQT